jgi:hypothetical protein
LHYWIIKFCTLLKNKKERQSEELDLDKNIHGIVLMEMSRGKGRGRSVSTPASQTSKAHAGLRRETR